MNYLKHFFASALTLLLLAACGGGDSGPGVTTYSGNTSQATLSSDNAPAFTKASSDAAMNQLDSNSIPTVLKSNSKIIEVQGKTTSMLQQATAQGICTTGSINVNGDQASGTINYSNCTFSNIAGTITVNGTASYSISNNATNITIRYTNFSITFTSVNGTVTEVIENMTIACANASCTISSDFTGTDGKVYRVANFDISGSNPYTISGRIYHPNHGYVDISGSVTISTCGNTERPTSGNMTIVGANGSATITYSDCNSFSIDINSTVTTANW